MNAYHPLNAGKEGYRPGFYIWTSWKEGSGAKKGKEDDERGLGDISFV